MKIRFQKKLILEKNTILFEASMNNDHNISEYNSDINGILSLAETAYFKKINYYDQDSIYHATISLLNLHEMVHNYIKENELTRLSNSTLSDNEQIIECKRPITLFIGNSGINIAGELKILSSLSYLL